MHNTKSTKPNKTKSCTTFLCEITRLKSQQKYLEGNQVKLTPEHFYDTADSPSNSSSSDHKHINFINDIEHFKIQLDCVLTEYRQKSQKSVTDICNQIKTIRDDTLHMDRLNRCPIDTIQERIIGINTQMELLHTRNANEIKMLRTQYQDFEKDADILLK